MTHSPVELHQYPAGHGRQSFWDFEPCVATYVYRGQSTGWRPRGQYLPGRGERGEEKRAEEKRGEVERNRRLGEVRKRGREEEVKGIIQPARGKEERKRGGEESEDGR